ncbi:MAG TPA: class I SAM-dependent methyltransferase [Gemmatimonadaceae bacterium]
MKQKLFDNGYFDKWYRHPDHRVGSDADLARLVRFAVTAAEYVLARPVRSVLDVGAGEARWQPILRKLRPRATYHGVDPSAYAVRRYGKRRNIVQGTLDDLSDLFPDRRFDLVVSCSVINYLPRDTMVRGIGSIAARTGGVAYLEIFTSEDDVEGDTHGWHAESSKTYHRIIRSARLIPCGLHCYIPADHASSLVALERA